VGGSFVRAACRLHAGCSRGVRVHAGWLVASKAVFRAQGEQAAQRLGHPKGDRAIAASRATKSAREVIIFFGGILDFETPPAGARRGYRLSLDPTPK